MSMSVPETFTGTPKQREILRLVLEAADRGEETTVEELRSRLSYKPAYQSLIGSLRYLHIHGMIEKKYQRYKPMTILPTLQTYAVIRNVST